MRQLSCYCFIGLFFLVIQFSTLKSEILFESYDKKAILKKNQQYKKRGIQTILKRKKNKNTNQYYYYITRGKTLSEKLFPFERISKFKLETGIDEQKENISSLYFTNNFFHSYTKWFDLNLGLRGDGHYQTSPEDLLLFKLDYDDNFMVLRSNDFKFTIGTQKIIWGKMDENSPSGFFNVQDYRKLFIDPLEERSLSQAAIRSEWYVTDGIKLDAVFMPRPRTSPLPKHNHYWSLIDKENGKIASYNLNSEFRPLVQNGTFANEKIHSADWGLRITGTVSDFDLGTNISYVHEKLPYYTISPEVLMRIYLGEPLADAITNSTPPTFYGRYPGSLVYGIEGGKEINIFNARFEVVYFERKPVTNMIYQYETKERVDYALATDIALPASHKLLLQFNGSKILEKQNMVLDQVKTQSFSFEWSKGVSNDTWIFKLQANFNLLEYDIYLKPEVSFEKWDNHNLIFSLLFFRGNQDTLGDFYKNHSAIYLGWRAAL